MVLPRLVGLVYRDLLVFTHTKKDVLSEFLNVTRVVLLVDDVRQTFLITLNFVLRFESANSSIFGALNVLVQLVVEEVLQELVFIEDLQVLQRASLVVIEHAVELGDLVVTCCALPISDLVLVRVGAILRYKVLILEILFHRLRSVEASIQSGLGLGLAFEQGLWERDDVSGTIG